MSHLHTIEIDGTLVGILTKEHGDKSYYFHSGVAPYDLLDGSRFARAVEARAAISRMSSAARQVRNASDGRAAGLK